MDRPGDDAAFEHRKRQRAVARRTQVAGHAARHGQVQGAGGGVHRRTRDASAFLHRHREVARALGPQVAVHRSGYRHRQVAIVHHADIAGHRPAPRHGHAQISRVEFRIGGGHVPDDPDDAFRRRVPATSAHDGDAVIRDHLARRPDRHRRAAELEVDGGVPVSAAHRLHRPVHNHAVDRALRHVLRAAYRDGVDDGFQAVIRAVIVPVDLPPAAGQSRMDVGTAVPFPPPAVEEIRLGNPFRPRIELRADGGALRHPNRPGIVAARVGADGDIAPGANRARCHIDDVALDPRCRRIVALFTG